MSFLGGAYQLAIRACSDSLIVSSSLTARLEAMTIGVPHLML